MALPAKIGETPMRKRKPPSGGMNRYPMTACGKTYVVDPDDDEVESDVMMDAPWPTCTTVAPAPSSNMFCFDPIPRYSRVNGTLRTLAVSFACWVPLEADADTDR